MLSPHGVAGTTVKIFSRFNRSNRGIELSVSLILILFYLDVLYQFLSDPCQSCITPGLQTVALLSHTTFSS